MRQPSISDPTLTLSPSFSLGPLPAHLRAMMLSSLDDSEDKPERTLLELVLLAESRGYKQAEEVGCMYVVCMYVRTYVERV